MTTYLLGIDVSTTATKALLIDERGSVIAVALDNSAAMNRTSESAYHRAPCSSLRDRTYARTLEK